MDFTLFFIITFFISILIYLFLDGYHNNLLEDRLNTFSEHNKPTNRYKETDKEKIDVKKEILNLFEPIVIAISERVDTKAIRQLLLEAGKPYTSDDITRFLTIKIALAMVGFLIGFLLYFSGQDPILKIVSLIICPLTLYRLPDFKLKAIIKKRCEEIIYNLPDALDLLTICVEAGLGIDAAFIKVAQEQSRTCPILAKELERVSKEVRSGITRQESFRNLANRNNVPDLKAFVALLIQTDKLGTSIAQSLRVYSDTMRTKRRQRVEAMSAKAGTKMVIPLVLFILPAMFVIILAPAAISLYNNFNTMGK